MERLQSQIFKQSQQDYCHINYNARPIHINGVNWPCPVNGNTNNSGRDDTEACNMLPACMIGYGLLQKPYRCQNSQQMAARSLKSPEGA